MRHKVFVLGGDHENTLGTVRCLGEAGVPFFLIVLTTARKSFVAKSRWVRDFRLIKSEEEALAALEENVPAEADAKPTIICCHDGLADFVDRNARIREKFCVPNAGGRLGGLSDWMDKNAVGEIASRSGFRVPKSKIVELSGTDFELDFPFPCIIKPVKSDEGSKHDFRICRTREELSAALRGLAKDGRKRMLVQEFLDVRSESLFLGVRTQKNEFVLADKIAKRIRGYKIENLGLTSFCETGFPMEESLRAATEKLLQETDFHGIFSIDLLETGAGTVFCEINLRTDANIYFACAAGTNLPAIWAGSVPATKSQADRRLLCMHEFPHIKNRLGRRQFFQLARDFCRTDVFAIFSRRDPKPFFAKIFAKCFS